MKKALLITCLLFASQCTAAKATNIVKELKVPKGFNVSIIGPIDHPRELAAAPNGDLFVGTGGGKVMIVPRAEGTPGPPKTFVRIGDAPAAGVALAGKILFIGTQFGVWKIPYQPGDRAARAKPVQIAKVRTSGQSRDHDTTSVAVAGDRLYVSVGSSCDACDPELDSTRASVQEMKLDGSEMHPRAVHIRNAVALATNPETQNVWAIPNGQDALEKGHPYEFADPILRHNGVADYGWPHCYENQRKKESNAKCSKVIVPLVIFPAYNAPIGAAIYPTNDKGKYAFPEEYRGGLFVGMHGSWHVPRVPPRVVFVPLKGDQPKTPADWKNPSTQWQEFLGGFQGANGDRIGRPTGIAVGSKGSLFVADDKANVIYRIRPER